MQQVDKKNYKSIFIVSFVTLFFIIGCSSKTQYVSNTKYYDYNITKDQLLDAVKKVFVLSDKGDFVVDTYRDEINATKSKAVYKLYTMDIRNDHFDFKIDENITQKTLKATLSLSRTYGIDEDEIDYLDEDSHVYKLFWNRVDYLLGINEDWSGCALYRFDGFLCDIVDLANNSANKEDLIDLNSTNSDINITNATIKIEASYQPKENKKEINNYVYAQPKFMDIQEKENKKNTTDNDDNVTVQSFKVKDYDYKENNQTKVPLILKSIDDLNSTKE